MVGATPFSKLPTDPFDRRHATDRRIRAPAGPSAPARSPGRDRDPGRDPADRRGGGPALPEPPGGGARGAGGLAGPARGSRRCRDRTDRAGRFRRPHPHRRSAQSRCDGRAGRGRLRRRPAVVEDRPGRRAQPHPPGPPGGARQLEGGQAVAGIAGSAGRGIHRRPASPGPARPPGRRRGRARPAVHRIRDRRSAGRRADRRRQADAPGRAPARRRPQERRCGGFGSVCRPGPDHDRRPRGPAPRRRRRSVPHPRGPGPGRDPEPDRRPALPRPEDPTRRRSRRAGRAFDRRPAGVPVRSGARRRTDRPVRRRRLGVDRDLPAGRRGRRPPGRPDGSGRRSGRRRSRRHGGQGPGQGLARRRPALERSDAAVADGRLGPLGPDPGAEPGPVVRRPDPGRPGCGLGGDRPAVGGLRPYRFRRPGATISSNWVG